MSDPVIGGNLIHVVEVDQDLCQQDYGNTCFARLEDGTRINLVNYSAQFNQSDWAADDVTVTSNQELSPVLGNTTADQVLETAATSEHSLQGNDFSIATAILNFSVYAKGVGRDELRIRVYNSTLAQVATVGDYDLTAETATPGGSATSAAISDEGDGWFRVSGVIDVSTVGSWTTGHDYAIQILILSGGADTYAGDVTKGMYYYGAQATEGATLEDYDETLGDSDDHSATQDDAGRSGEKCFKTRATCQDSANYNIGTLTIKCARAVSNLPRDEYIYPNLESITTQPSRLNTNSRSRNEPLGQRASMTATFIDHPDTDRFTDPYADERVSGAARADGIGYDPFSRGFFWSKWRARNLYYLGRPIRALQGVVDPVVFSNLTTRNYVIESVEGPDRNGLFKITGKDPLKLADNDRAQAPVASQGELLGTGANAPDIDDTETSFDVTPSGILASDYPSSTPFKIAVGKEIMEVTNVSGDTVTVTRGVNNTEAEAHDEGDAVQLVREYSGESVDDILYDLLVNDAGIDPAFINTSAWATEVSTYIPFNFSAVIPKPVGVKTLIGELAEQAGFSIWWDEVNQTIRLAAVKQPGVGSLTIDDDQIIEGSFKVKDRPDARISQVWVNFGLINPTESIDNDNNYAATLVSVDAEAGQEAQYDQDVIRKINSRWIPAAGGKAVATNLASRLLSRFRDIIREFTFSLPSYRADEIKMGDVHNLSTMYANDIYGLNETIPVRIMAVEQAGDVLRVEAEELRFKFDPDELLATRNIPISTPITDINLRDVHDQIYSTPPIATTDIVCTIETEAVTGGSTPSEFGFDVGDWSDYSFNSISIYLYGVASGAGGNAGSGYTGGKSPVAATDGGNGGWAFYTRENVNVYLGGTVQAGGGGGGGGGGTPGLDSSASSGGGGGGGYLGGAGGGAVAAGTPGNAGTLSAGGTAGTTGTAAGGNGGGPNQSGSAGSGANPGAGGSPGGAIDGDSYITWIEEDGNLTGGTGTNPSADGTINGSRIN